MKSWETVVQGHAIRVECEGLLRDTMRLLVDGERIAERTGGWLESSNELSGDWRPSGPDGERRHVRAWVGSSWTSAWSTLDCRVWLDGEVVFEDNVFTRAVDLVNSAKRAVAKL